MCLTDHDSAHAEGGFTRSHTALINAHAFFAHSRAPIFQASALLVNVFTLFIGLMLVITAFLEQQAVRAGEAFDTTQRDVISVIVFIANVIVIGLPVLRTLSESSIPGRAAAACRPRSRRPAAGPAAPPPAAAPADLPPPLPRPTELGTYGDFAFIKVKRSVIVLRALKRELFPWHGYHLAEPAEILH